ncbi:glucan biosynthesis protein G [Cognatiyoonia sp. IB215182]|uniref:glucan biosynthesis protein n=1 Tax=Cognatiyoonia sp. IB215182 TaxID=3097353 RepID=UPI002A133CE4|nr:glucan biosynthesis protein G [Cognatiyoonia sp. IB215182]MDX8352497.1 glucan biosynthesis protein G [Cognatiyoonia sp. IB215182]
MLRREFVASLAALVASGAFAQTTQTPAEPGLQVGAGTPFTPDFVTQRARALSQSAYEEPRRIPEAWTSISYDDYQAIWFDGRNALWNDEADTPLRMDVFAPGLYFPTPISIAMVENGMAKPLRFDMGVFDKTDKFPDLPIDDSLGYSGLRLRAELERAGIYQEFTVFQGASYFRAIGTGDIYGASARGLAVDTASPTGEEFPEFREFWLEKPVPGADTFVLHALLDSPSCTGAYRFAITPGAPLVMDVDAHVFARRDIDNIGIAPLTSMFQYDQTNRHRFTDFRPAVHDSDGLQIINGAGETIWRPLANPKELQISAFVDNNPKGFGLMQRARNYSDFADLEALYHRRPGVWIEPKEDWGRGSVALIEIPTPSEIFDNIVCYWRPSGGVERGSENRFSYRLTWGDAPGYGQGLTVLNTMIGSAFDNNGMIVLIDFEAGATVPDDLNEIDIITQSSAGEVSGGVLQRNPETGGPRLAFKFYPGEATLIEFRAQLQLADAPLSEVWLYRWTA